MKNIATTDGHHSLLPKSLKRLWPRAAIVCAITIVILVVFFMHSDLTKGGSGQPINMGTGAGRAQSSSANLWDNQYGILAYVGTQSIVGTDLNGDNINGYILPHYLELLNPNNGAVIAKVGLPPITSLMRLSDGKRYTLVLTNVVGYNTGGGNMHITADYDHSTNYRYIPVQFDKNADGTQDVGYYDLATGNVTDVSNNTRPKQSDSFNAVPVSPIDDKNPVFSLTSPNLLLFCRYNCSTATNIGDARDYAFDMSNGKIEPHSSTENEMNCESGQVYVSTTYGSNAHCALAGRGPSAGMTIDESRITDSNGDTTPIDTMQNGQPIQISCSAVKWLDAATILGTCDTLGNGSDLYKIDLGSMVKVAPIAANDATGYYQIPAPTDLLPSNQRTNNNPVVSPDGKTIVFLSSLNGSKDYGLYSVPVSGGQPKKITDLGSDGQSLQLLAWW